MIPDKVVYKPDYFKYGWHTRISIYRWTPFYGGGYHSVYFENYIVLTKPQLRELYETYLVQHQERDIRLHPPQNRNRFSLNQS